MMKLDWKMYSTSRDGSSLAVTGHLNEVQSFSGEQTTTSPGQITRHPIAQQQQPQPLITRTFTRKNQAATTTRLAYKTIQRDWEAPRKHPQTTTKHPKHL